MIDIKFEEKYQLALNSRNSENMIYILKDVITTYSDESIILNSENLFLKNYKENYNKYKPQFTKFLKNKDNSKLYYLHLASEWIQKIPFVSSLLFKNNPYRGLKMYELKFQTWLNEDGYRNKREVLIKDLKKNWSEYQTILSDLLLEEKSKKIYCDVLFARIFKDYEFLYRNYDDQLQYFDTELVNFKPNEVILECGGFDGLTITELKSFNDNFKKLVVFEPDAINATKIRSKFADDHRIEIVEKGTSYKDGKLYFQKVNEMLVIAADSSEISFEVTAIDSAHPDHYDYLFMDIEGSEMDTLKGAEHTIRYHNPRLAISIYHKFDDMWKIPQFIKKTNPNYSFYIRHYSTDQTDTVVYALPN